ncbi:MAG: efflux RND transporter periplasmic adaptor subunit [Flavihumibacter sp.]
MNKTLRTFIILALVAGSIALIAFMLKKNKAAAEEKTAIVAQTNATVAVRVDTVQKSIPALNVIANGNFEPWQQLAFSAEKSGRVVKVLVDEGDYVRKGQVLATIRVDQLNVDLQSARNSYASAKADYDRYENAFKTGGVTKQQLDQARLALDNAVSKLEASQINLSDAAIRSSIDGIVNARKIEPGSVVAPGTELFQIVNVSRLKLKVNVNEDQVAQLSVGRPVTVKASVFPDKTFSGKVSFIGVQASEALNFPVEIVVTANPGNVLRAGMYGTAVFDFAKQQPVTMVPRTAFIGSVNSNQVFVVTNGTAHLQKLTAGRIVGDKVEVLEGLKEGDIVITSGQINLAEGNAVTIIR